MVTFRDLSVLLILTGSILCASLFVCTEVNSYEEMAGIRIGLPTAFLSLNAQRYTPLTFPQCFRVGSPWEDSMQVLWRSLSLNFVIVFGALLCIVWAAGPTRRCTVLYAMRWLMLPPAVTAAFIGAGVVGVLTAALANVWEEAVTGFLCAVAVVMSAYILAPKFKLATATAAFLVGAIVAWNLVSPPSPRPEFSENTGITLGIPTYQSILVTYVGGTLSWVACFMFARRHTSGA